eukprot:97043-Pleurochrysis_carterae.AAC.1
MHGPNEGPGDVRMYEPARVRRLVMVPVVRLTGCVGFNAGVASVKATMGERGRRVGGDGGQRAETGGAVVESAMHAASGVCGRHHADVMCGARGMYG